MDRTNTKNASRKFKFKTCLSELQLSAHQRLLNTTNTAPYAHLEESFQNTLVFPYQPWKEKPNQKQPSCFSGQYTLKYKKQDKDTE